MPLHDHSCLKCHRTEERYVPIDRLNDAQFCECGGSMERVFLRFPYSWVEADICYDSPVDGRHITSKQARIEDLARTNSIPYDPEMKKDADRRVKDSDAELDKAVDDFVEKEIHEMPARKREKLVSELQHGAEVDIVRQTLGA